MFETRKTEDRKQGKHFNKRFLLHVFFWLFYVLFFGSIYGKYGNDYKWYLFESLCMLPFVMIATYCTIYGLLPFYLKKRNLPLTLIFLVLLIFSVTLGERIFLRKINQLPITFDSLFGVTFLYLMLETNFIVAIALAIKIVKKWKVEQEKKFEMEKLNLQTELNLLKAQLHPHFLFNTMNNLNELLFFAENSKPGLVQKRKEFENEGIGLKNVKKRLEIIYGERQSLNIAELQNKFSVYLSIYK